MLAIIRMMRLLILSKENMHSIKYTKQAEVDLADAISHIAEESVPNAMHYLVGYEDKIELLRDNPFMGTHCKNKYIKRACRVLVYKSHIVVYKVQEAYHEILIIRIFHTSVNYAHLI